MLDNFNGRWYNLKVNSAKRFGDATKNRTFVLSFVVSFLLDIIFLE